MRSAEEIKAVEKTFLLILDENKAIFTSTIRLILGSSHDPSIDELDILQSTVLLCLSKIRRGEEIDDIKSFFFRVAKNLIFTQLRKEKSLKRNSIQVPLDDRIDRLTSESLDPLHFTLRQQVFQEIARIFYLLPESQREVITLRFAEGLSILEVAAIMDKTEGAIKALQRRALANMRMYLSDYFDKVEKTTQV